MNYEWGGNVGFKARPNLRAGGRNWAAGKVAAT